MNRIRELREAMGLSVAELADRVGTSRQQIERLEKGERRLTVDWMQKLARHLECSPAELISNAVLAEGEDDVAPATLSLNGVAAAIRRKGLVIYQVTGSSVIETGILPGDIITVDESPDAIAAMKTGDVALVEILDPPMLVLRGFFAPSILVTNRPGANLAIRTDDRSIRLRIRGVVVRE